MSTAAIPIAATAHFGFATPVLNIEREKTADALAALLRQKPEAAGERLTVHNTNHTAARALSYIARRQRQAR